MARPVWTPPNRTISLVPRTNGRLDSRYPDGGGGVPDYYDPQLVPATLWVNGTTGNDSYTYEQVRNSGGSLQWATIARAVRGVSGTLQEIPSQAAQAGDVVDIAPGVYWETGSQDTLHRFGVVLHPANNGTQEAPIIFRGSENGTVEIRAQEGVRGPMIGGYRSYIYWHKIYINDYYCGSLSDTGPVHFGGSHCRLTGSHVEGHTGTYYWGYTHQQAWVCGSEVNPDYEFPSFGGNYRLVSLEGADHCIIADNIIERALVYSVNCETFGADPQTSVTPGVQGGQNEVCIMTYDSNNCIFEHNILRNAGGGVFIKGIHAPATQDGNIIRYNLVYNAPNGIRVLSGSNTLVYQNVLYDSSALYFGWGTQNAGSRLVNNTVFVSRNEVPAVISSYETNDQLWMNNIFRHAGTRNDFFSGGGVPTQEAIINRNLYYRTPSWNQSMFYDWNGGSTAATLSQWQSSGFDLDGIFQTDPLFVDEEQNDFRLQELSPALELGRDVLNISGNGENSVIPAGAYITGNEIIGPRGL